MIAADPPAAVAADAGALGVGTGRGGGWGRRAGGCCAPFGERVAAGMARVEKPRTGRPAGSSVMAAPSYTGRPAPPDGSGGAVVDLEPVLVDRLPPPGAAGEIAQ